MNSTPEKIVLSQEVPEGLAGKRLDQIASILFPDYSRSRLQEWIKSGELTVDGGAAKTRDKLQGGECLRLRAEPESNTAWQPEAISLPIIYEDESLLVIDKPVGLVVHPAAGNREGTLLNGLIHHLPQLESVPRAGIVHRLDKDTSGLMVVAKTLEAHTSLVRQLQERTVSREYQAVTQGVMTGGGSVDANIGRHPRVRTKMAVFSGGGAPRGKQAITHYRVVERFAGHTHIRVKLETGRTHQIRVHMAYLGYPLVGDPVYGGRLKLPKQASPPLVSALRNFKRQALHAASLGLIHPLSRQEMCWETPLPSDMQALLKVLRDAG